ncbi:MAG: Zn-ribbon domain-containing OB-fold protein [Parvibaculaceae bacterium]
MAYGSGPAQETRMTPLPRITPLNKAFWDYARQSIFAVQVCDACGDTHVPESPACPRCLSTDQRWKPASGKGTLESWADFHRAYWDGFKDVLPYRTCLLRLDEGPLFISNLVGDPAKAKLGARVRVIFEPLTHEIALPKFVVE